MLAIEWRHSVWAAGILSVCRGVEPKAQMVGLYRTRGFAIRTKGRRVLQCIREWRICEDLRCRRDAGGNDECLDAETAPKVLDGIAVCGGLHIPLIPGKPKRCV